MKSGGSHLRIVKIKMTWLITGGTGQLGIAISQELGERGILFEALGSQDLDITQGQIVRDVIAKMSPKVIINCAAWTDVDGAENDENSAFRVNADGAENVAIAAKACGAKLVHISTDYVFSGDSEVAWKIDDKRSPNSAYGRTKLAGENKVISAYPERTLLIRTAWLYSPWKKNFMKTVLRQASKNSEPMSIVNDQIGQPTSAIDLANRIIEIATSPIKSGVFHGTNSGSATWFDFASEIMSLNGDDQTRFKPVSSSEFKQLAPRPKYSVLDHSAWANYGFDPMRDWKLALRHTMIALEAGDETGLNHA
jgi:dTDP-4-dehydrorhamnose reductase